MGWIIIVFFFALVIVAAAIYAAQPEVEHTDPQLCPHCQTKGLYAYRFSRVDGGPDLRYGHNPIICVRCGQEHGTRPDTPEEKAELEKWQKHGYDQGRRGEESALPVEIRPLAGQTTKLSAAWCLAHFKGHTEYEWETGFADGLAGKQQRSGIADFNYTQAWIEGDAKRQGLHYFPTSDAKEKVKDVEALGVETVEQEHAAIALKA